MQVNQLYCMFKIYVQTILPFQQKGFPEKKTSIEGNQINNTSVLAKQLGTFELNWVLWSDETKHESCTLVVGLELEERSGLNNKPYRLPIP